MTTTVTVRAHCDPETTQVRVTVLDNEGEEHEAILEDQETADYYIWDDAEVVVKEVPKTKEETK